MCLAFCTLYVERGATPALHLRGWGDGGRRGEVAHGGRARGEMGGGGAPESSANNWC